MDEASRGINLALTGTDKGSAITELGKDHVIVVTGYYVLLHEGIPEAAGTVEYKGKTYTLIRSSWESYYNQHRVDRHALEEEIGHSIPQDWVDHTYRERKISFVSYHLWRYVAAEVIFLTLLFMLTLHILRRTTRLLWIPFVLIVPLVLSFALTRYYSPAFLDADFFYQRIVVEYLAFGFFMLPFFSPVLAFAGVGLAMGGLWKLVNKVGKRVPFVLSHRISIAGGIVIVPMTVVLAAGYHAYRVEQAKNHERLDAVRSRLSVGTLLDLIARLEGFPVGTVLGGAKVGDMYLTSQDIDALFPPLDSSQRSTLGIIIPLGVEKYAFFYKIPNGNYADIRLLDNQTGRDEILQTLSNGQAHTQGLGAFLRRRIGLLVLRHATEPVKDENRRVLAVVIVSRL